MRVTIIVLPIVVLSALSAQSTAPADRLVRIEENPLSLKDSVRRTDIQIDALQQQTRVLQDKVIAVESQNKIIIGIALAAFTIGLAFLVWLYKKLEALLQQQRPDTLFTSSDRHLLEGIATKILGGPARSAAAGGVVSPPPSGSAGA